MADGDCNNQQLRELSKDVSSQNGVFNESSMLSDTTIGSRTSLFEPKLPRPLTLNVTQELQDWEDDTMKRMLGTTLYPLVKKFLMEKMLQSEQNLRRVSDEMNELRTCNERLTATVWDLVRKLVKAYEEIDLYKKRAGANEGKKHAMPATTANDPKPHAVSVEDILQAVGSRLKVVSGADAQNGNGDLVLENSTVVSTKIDALADVTLAQIFKRLPLCDRLLVSEVCKRWRDISRMPWTEIVYLDLSPIPDPNIAAIIKQCPNLQTVHAEGKFFGPGELAFLTQIPLATVTLHKCRALIESDDGVISDPLSAVFSNNLQNASWSELSLADFSISVQASAAVGNGTMGFPATLPCDVKRLQISELLCNVGGHSRTQMPFPASSFCEYSQAPLFDGLEQCRQLECLILNGNGNPNVFHENPILLSMGNESNPIYRTIGGLSNLRELYLGAEYGFTPNLSPIYNLPSLEVLFLHDFCIFQATSLEAFKKLTTEHVALRILVLTGRTNRAIQLPTRRQYPNGLGSDPVPLLHVFMDNTVSAKISFPPTPCAAAIVYQISRPLAQFLGRQDIAPIFEGVWIAKKIKEATQHGCSFYTN